MDIFSIDNTLFELGGTGVSLLEFLSVIFGLTCVFLAGRGKSFNYWFGYVYTLLLFFLFSQKHLYSSMLLQPVSLAISIFGHYHWTHPPKGEENKKQELRITLLTNHERVVVVGVIAAFTLIWGFFVKGSADLWPNLFPPAKMPFFDACVVGFVLLAQFLSAKKKIDCWAAWLIVNIINIILYLFAGLVFMPIVSAAYLILAFFGFATWRKQWRNQNETTTNQ